MRYLLLFLLIFEFNFRISAQETLVTGLEDACESDINRNVTPGAIVLSSNFINPPKSVDLSKYLPAIGDQGTQGSCTAFSVAEALTILRNQHDSKTFNIRILQDLNTFCSPAFIFNIGKSKYPFPRSENCEDGISFIDAFIVARDYGIVTWPFIKYNPNGTAGCESKNFPDYKALKEGQKNKIVTFQRPDLDLNLFKCLLADNPGYPICIAVNIDKEYKKASNKESGSAIWAKKGISIAGQVNNRHAMLIVGYNDSIQCFKVLDSRGIEKGDNGFLWLSYDLLASRVIYDAYVCSFDGSLLKSQKAINSGSADLYLNIGSTKSTWLKQGYFRTFNGFRISCNEIDLLNKRVTFRIVDAYTKKVLVANITLTLYQQKYFTLKGKTFSLSLKSFERKGYGIFKKAIVFDISVSNEKIGEQFEPFIKYGNLKEDFERLFYGFISKTKDEMQNTEYIGQLINFSVGDIVSSNSNLLHTLPDNNIDSLVQEIKPFTFINNDSVLVI